MIDIIHRTTCSVLWSVDADNLCEADLCGADLRGADLCEANLCEADLREANLREANLREANLRGADLRGADLREANLCEANLCEADLREANLREANLREANLRGAIGNGVEVCSLHGPYVAVWTAYNLWIGCQSADHATWWDRDEAFFMRFSDDGAERWAAWKPILQAAIAATTGTRLANWYLLRCDQ